MYIKVIGIFNGYDENKFSITIMMAEEGVLNMYLNMQMPHIFDSVRETDFLKFVTKVEANLYLQTLRKITEK
jgi:hypothetical protein